jgi:hypothetical protein
MIIILEILTVYGIMFKTADTLWMPWCVLCYVYFRNFIAVYLHNHNHDRLLQLSLSVHCLFKCNSCCRFWSAVTFSGSVHSAALYTSVRLDLQIRICHSVLVWVLLWTGTEVNPTCGNIIICWKAVTVFSSCHFEHLALNLNFDLFSVTVCSFLRISVSLLKHLFWFQLTSDQIMALFGFPEYTEI